MNRIGMPASVAVRITVALAPLGGAVLLLGLVVLARGGAQLPTVPFAFVSVWSFFFAVISLFLSSRGPLRSALVRSAAISTGCAFAAVLLASVLATQFRP